MVGAFPARQPGRGAATAAVIFGVLGILGCWVPLLPLLLGGLACVLAFIALGRARAGASPATPPRRGLAVTGLVTGLIALLLGTVISIGYILFFREAAPKFSDLGQCWSIDDPTLRDQCLDEVFNQLYPESTDAPIPDSGNPDPENPEAGSPDQAPPVNDDSDDSDSVVPGAGKGVEQVV